MRWGPSVTNSRWKTRTARSNGNQYERILAAGNVSEIENKTTITDPSVEIVHYDVIQT